MKVEKTASTTSTLRISRVVIVAICMTLALSAHAQQAANAAASPDDISKLLQRIDQLEAKVKQLEENQAAPSPVAAQSAQSRAAAATPEPPPPVVEAEASSEGHEHSMQIPGAGPVLKIKGFFDFNFGAGSIANPLVFPIIDNGCGTCGKPATPAHSAFQAGEFDLFLTSRLSHNLSFLSEVVFEADATNAFGVDLERYALTYKANPYFSASAGRFHTSIGYYNTAYHHGAWFSTADGRPIMYLFEDSGGVLPVHLVGLNFTGAVPNTEKLGLHWIAEVGNGLSSNPHGAWFSTADGRPIMYLFEDSGGVLPVHLVGLNFTGAVPNTEKLGLHWIAEVGNGLSSNPFATTSVQNFYSDRNYKATNLAWYIRPQAVSGLQIGGSWYHDGINPSQAQNPLSIPEIMQNIESAYVVYLASGWEFLNEAVMLSNHVSGTTEPFRSPMAYVQAARKFGIYKPYFRYQYVRDNINDPINILKGTYYGPSVGLRVDFAEYAALKAQFNHLYESNQLPGNGLNLQLAFTF